MSKFYKVMLNSAKTHTVNSWGHYCKGGIEVYPTSFLQEKKYSGYGYVFAEIVGNHLEEIILGKTIYLDPNGISDTRKLSNLSINDLLNELNRPLSCNSYEEVSKIEVADFIKKINSDKKMLKKYCEEIKYEENKTIIREEIQRRRNETLKKNNQEKEADRIIADFKRNRRGRK